MGWLKYFFILLTISLFSLQAETLKPLDISISHETVGNATSVYEDSSTLMHFDDIAKLPDNAFVPLNKPVASNGFTNSAFWYRVKVNNPTQSILTKLMVIQPAWLDSVTLYIISPGGKVSTEVGGTLYPHDVSAIDHYLINFKHSFEKGISTIYLRVKTRDPFIVSMSIMDESTYFSDHSAKSLFNGFIYGGLVAILIYNLFLFLAMKKRYYGFYVITILAFIIMHATYNGYTFMYLFGNYPQLQTWAQSSVIYLFMCTWILFTKEFLNLEAVSSKLHRSLNYAIYIILALLVITPFIGGYQYHIFFALSSVILGKVLLMVVSIYAWIKGNQSVRFFIIGLFSGFTGAVITLMTVMSYIPYTYLNYKASDIGMFLDVLFLSLALADRMKLIYEEKNIAQKEAKTDTLSGLLNLRSYYEISNREYKKLKQQDSTFSVIMMDIDDFKEVNDSYGHSVGDMVIKSIGNILMKNIREHDYAFRRGGDEFLIFLPGIQNDKAYNLAERIRSEIESKKIEVDGLELNITCSFGVSEFDKDDEDIEAVVKRSDNALYEAKKDHKNSVKVSTK